MKREEIAERSARWRLRWGTEEKKKVKRIILANILLQIMAPQVLLDFRQLNIILSH